ncbi:hypothetical protein RJ639_004582 [Escallonia herrerae]|uniref:Protein REVERSION-TO-ETHYLENE SENSITIVITY1 n=1 Tax=Escallonia herrerae TaxID=1293975 RepID=A0AA88W1R8_9ASTE|nr:hypothetical protein RJ639_004582 [Escallonia herrerae]
MELKPSHSIEDRSFSRSIQHELWPLDEIDLKKAKFPCCLVWTPLPVVSWLAPFIGHVGICREDGAILDFSGSNFVNVDDFAFVTQVQSKLLERLPETLLISLSLKYLEQCCFPPNLAGHTCKHGYRHGEYGTAMSWDDALQSSTRHFEHKSYNLFTCNCHSFAADCLNRLCYGGSMAWNMVNIAALLWFKGRWVDSLSVLRSFLPFIVVACLGVMVVGWLFLVGLLSFSSLLLGWFLLGTYCAKDLLEC